MKYRIRIALVCLTAGWYGSAVYYGFPAAESAAFAASPAQDATKAGATTPIQVEVVCTFDFPPLLPEQVGGLSDD